MNNDEVISLMMSRLAGRTNPNLRSMLLLELNQKIRELESGPIKPWFLEKETEGQMVIGQNYIELPEGFTEEVEEGAFVVSGASGPAPGTEPTLLDIDNLSSNTDHATRGTPTAYALYGDRIYLGPTPDNVYPYKLKYYGRTIPIKDLPTPVTNRWLLDFFNLTIMETLLIVARTHLKAPELESGFQAERDKAFDTFYRAVESRKHAGRTYLRGEAEN